MISLCHKKILEIKESEYYIISMRCMGIVISNNVTYYTRQFAISSREGVLRRVSQTTHTTTCKI